MDESTLLTDAEKMQEALQLLYIAYVCSRSAERACGHSKDVRKHKCGCGFSIFQYLSLLPISPPHTQTSLYS